MKIEHNVLTETVYMIDSTIYVVHRNNSNQCSDIYTRTKGNQLNYMAAHYGDEEANELFIRVHHPRWKEEENVHT